MYRRNARGWEKHFDFTVIDILCLELSLLIAHFVRHGFVSPFHFKSYATLFAGSAIWDFILILLLETMKNVLKRGYYIEAVKTLKHTLLLFGSITAFMFVAKAGQSYSRTVVILSAIIYLFLTYAVRLLWKRLLRNTDRSKNANSLLIMTNEDNAAELIQSVKESVYRNYKITGLVINDEKLKGTMVAGMPVVATFDSVVAFTTRHWVDEILVSIGREEDLPEKAIRDLTQMGVTVHLNLDKSSQVEGARRIVGYVGDRLVISLSMNYMTPRQYAAKRLLDICGGLVGCVLTGILYLFIAPKIKKESPGPVFFVQERIGQNGKPFKFYKFRSMYLDAEERKAELMKQNRRNDDLMFKMDFDPRVIGNRIDENGKPVTGIGEFIRRTSLDEFPQFYNVLKGDMSLVGTRPPLKEEYKLYSPQHKARLATKPGITGMWQISGRSDILDFDEVVRLDTKYINEWSFGLDIKILLKTVMVVLKHEGSM